MADFLMGRTEWLKQAGGPMSGQVPVDCPHCGSGTVFTLPYPEVFPLVPLDAPQPPTPWQCADCRGMFSVHKAAR